MMYICKHVIHVGQSFLHWSKICKTECEAIAIQNMHSSCLFLTSCPAHKFHTHTLNDTTAAPSIWPSLNDTTTAPTYGPLWTTLLLPQTYGPLWMTLLLPPAYGPSIQMSLTIVHDFVHQSRKRLSETLHQSSLPTRFYQILPAESPLEAQNLWGMVSAAFDSHLRITGITVVPASFQTLKAFS